MRLMILWCLAIAIFPLSVLPAQAADKHKKPRCGDNLKPEYTENAKAAGVEGVVVLIAAVDTSGCVQDVSIQKGLGYGLDQKALQAVKTWKFTPARKDGTPVAVKIRVEVPFKLPKDTTP